MRRIPLILFSLALFNSGVLPAQQDSTGNKKWLTEVGMIGYSNIYKFARFGNARFWQYTAQGVYWKAFKKRNAFRASLSYLNTSVRYQNDQYFGIYFDYLAGGNSSITEIKGGEATFGFQHVHSLKKRFSLYYAMDMNYAYLRFWSYYSYGNPDGDYGSVNFSHLYGLSQMLGFRIIPHKRLVLNVETGFKLQMSKEVNTGYYSSFNPGGFWWCPLHISAGFVFGK